MKIKKNLYILLAIIAFLSVFFYQCNRSDSIASLNMQQKQPPKQQFDKDKQQIEETFIDIVEFYRQSKICDTINAESDHSVTFEPYSERLTPYCEYVPSPFPTSTQLTAYVDTIIYNADRQFCIALIIILNNYSDLPGLQNSVKEHPYDAFALVGYRDIENSKYKIYPNRVFSVICVESYLEAKRIIRDCYFKTLSKTYGGSFDVFEGEPYGYNLGNPCFFEKSPLFKKYDDSRYNFQMYHHLGKDYEYLTDYYGNK